MGGGRDENDTGMNGAAVRENVGAVCAREYDDMDGAQVVILLKVGWDEEIGVDEELGGVRVVRVSGDEEVGGDEEPMEGGMVGDGVIEMAVAV